MHVFQQTPEEMSAAVYILSTVTGYVLTSALLLKCPSLLHRRKKEPFISRHISHRGGQWGSGPGNPSGFTLPHVKPLKCHVVLLDAASNPGWGLLKMEPIKGTFRYNQTLVLAVR